jgi:hypothetical protein
MENKFKEQCQVFDKRLNDINNKINEDDDDIEVRYSFKFFFYFFVVIQYNQYMLNKMHGEKNLIELPGADPSKYAQRVLLQIYGNNLQDYICTDDSKYIHLIILKCKKDVLRKDLVWRIKLLQKHGRQFEQTLIQEVGASSLLLKKQTREAAASSSNSTLPTTIATSGTAPAAVASLNNVAMLIDGQVSEFSSKSNVSTA